MNRAAIIATIVASILSFPSLSLAASDAEIGVSGDKCSRSKVRGYNAAKSIVRAPSLPQGVAVGLRKLSV
jgi:hypothetical protein